jgi:hypothetical protein
VRGLPEAGVTDYMFGPTAEMLRCGCGAKYLVRMLPDRTTNQRARAFFDWYSGEQIFGHSCPACSADLYGRWLEKVAEWESA